MKKHIKPNIMNLLKKAAITMLVIIGLTFTIDSIAQDAPPPPPNHGESGNQPGGNAPIGSGIAILIGLGAAYGGRKIYQMRKDNLEE